MKKIITILFFITLIFNSVSQKIFINKGFGKIDNYNLNKVYLLIGEWEFYWNQLLTPQNISNIKKKDYIFVNGSWTSKYPHWGYATYHCKIAAPKGKYILWLHQVISAYKIWINDTLVSEYGIVGTDRKTSVPKPGNNMIIFFNDKDTIDILIQVSNFHHQNGGLQEKIYIGSPSAIIDKRNFYIHLQAFVVGAEFIFLIFFIALFILNRDKFVYLLLALGISFLIVFELVNNEAFLLSNFTNISWNIAKKIDFFSNYIRLAFFTTFVYYYIKDTIKIKKSILLFIIAISTLLSLFVLITPSYIFSFTLNFFTLVTLASFIYFLVISIKAIIIKIPFSILFTLGMAALLITSINDILFSMNIINTGYYLSFGLLFFIGFFSLIFSLEYSYKLNYIKFSKILQSNEENFIRDVMKYPNYDIISFLKTLEKYINFDYLELWLYYNNSEILEIKKENDKYLKSNFENKITTDFNFKKIPKNNFFNKEKIIFNIYKEKVPYACIILMNSKKNFKKIDFLFLEKIIDYLTNSLENYKYYNEIKNINENLELIVEARIELIYEQKNTLKKEVEVLQKNLNELQKINNKIQTTNKELLNIKEELQARNELLEKTKNDKIEITEKLKEKNKLITESIFYANHLRSALLKNSEKDFENQKFFSISFTTKEISGDFYFVYNTDTHKIILLFNTTATNIVAILISTLISNILNEIIIEQNITESLQIAKNLEEKYLQIFNENNKLIFESFKVSILSLNKSDLSSTMCLIGQNLLIIRKKDKIFLKGSKYEIGGGFLPDNEKSYKSYNLKLYKGDIIYLYTEGCYLSSKTKSNSAIDELNFIEKILNLTKESTNFSNHKKIIENFIPQKFDATLLALQL